MRPVSKTGNSATIGNVGRKLRDLRKARNLTQSDLAARIGIQQSDLCRMENGQYRVNLETLVKILSEFEITFAEFFQEDTHGELTPEERALLRAFRGVDADAREQIRRFAAFLRAESADAEEAPAGDDLDPVVGPSRQHRLTGPASSGSVPVAPEPLGGGPGAKPRETLD
jgi:transcriptional regulator with XRE-family HTH domain